MHWLWPQTRLLACLGTCLGLVGSSGCFEDPLTSLTDGETTGDGDGDPGDGDGDPGDGEPGDGDGEPGDGDMGDGDGDGDGEPGDGDGEPQCEANETLCDGVCTNLSTDSSNCGVCGMPCPGFTLCGESMCKPEKYAFATSDTYQGNFNAAQADLICQQAAVLANLPDGDLYRAWFSTLATSPMQWLGGDGIWRLRGDDDVVVAYSREQLFGGDLAAPINRDEYGQPLVANWSCDNTVQFPVWTATSAAGSADGPDCMGWSSNLGSDVGAVGNAAVSDQGWTASAGCLVACSEALRLYCFEQ